MKTTTLYKTGALCLAFLSAGVFTAFDDAQTDEQKIEAAYNQLVTDFKMEQDQLCKTQALAAAQTQWMEMKNSMTEGGQTAVSGGNEKPTKPTSTSSSSSSSQGGNNGSSQANSNNTPPPPPKPTSKGSAAKSDKTTTTTKTGGGKGGAVKGKTATTKTGGGKGGAVKNKTGGK